MMQKVDGSNRCSISRRLGNSVSSEHGYLSRITTEGETGGLRLLDAVPDTVIVVC